MKISLLDYELKILGDGSLTLFHKEYKEFDLVFTCGTTSEYDPIKEKQRKILDAIIGALYDANTFGGPVNVEVEL